MTNVIYFEVEISGDVIGDSAKPIFNEYDGGLIGGFVLKKGNTVACFLSSEKPYSLFLSSEQSFYFTTIDGPDGKVNRAVISEYAIKPTSIKVEAKEAWAHDE